MLSFISSSKSTPRWRSFFLLCAVTAVLCIGVIYAFVVLVDPFDTLPLSPPAQRWPVASNARFAFPALARSERFDSAIFGTSTSRLLRPAALDPLFGARFANLAMNDATVYEQSRLMDVFRRAHPHPRVMMVGLDVRWCVTGDSYEKLTPRPFPAWMYGANPWAGYTHLFNMYAVQEAGQEFGILIGIKRPTYGRDGYTSFVPPDSEYDPARVAAHLRGEGPELPPGPHDGPPATWRYPALETLAAELHALPPETRKVLFFVPLNHVLLPAPGTEPDAVWSECKRRVGTMARTVPNLLVIDFMRPSPITDHDDNYWDALHYRVDIADRLAHDLARAARGNANTDFVLLGGVS